MNGKLIAIMSIIAVMMAGVALVASEETEGATGDATTVTYVANGTTVLIDPVKVGDIYTYKTIDAIGASAPAGATFSAWYVIKTAADGETPAVVTACGAQTSIEGAVTVYAGFVPTEYKITFGTVGTATVATTLTGTTATTDDTPAKTVYLTADAEKTVYPKLSDAVAVIKDADGATVSLPEAYSYNTDKTAQYIPLTAEKLAESVKADATVELTYQTVYKVTWRFGEYVVNGVSELGATGYTTALAKPGAPAKDNYTFDGWMVSGTLVTKADGELGDYKITADTEFVAKYTPQKLTVTFLDANGVKVSEVIVLYGDKITDVPEGTWDFDFSKAITSDTTIKAYVSPEPVEPVEPVAKSDNTTTYVLIALFAILIIIGLVLGIRVLKKA